MENNKHVWPTLYEANKAGKLKLWKIQTIGNKIVIEHGLEDGKLTKSEKIIKKGKNLGKKNETTPESQAFAEAKARWIQQMETGYNHQKNEAARKSNTNSTYFPMLAQTGYSSRSPEVCQGTKKVTKLPKHLICQRKLNGVRCIAVCKRGKVTLYSRKMKIYSVPKRLIKELQSCMVDEIWDGEIYVHGWEFERIVSAVKRHNNDTDSLQFHRYDIPSFVNDTMLDRAEMMMLLRVTGLIKQVPYDEIKDIKTNELIWDTVKEYHDKYVADGYEGIIIRDAQATYQWKHRGKRMYKYKEFKDAEFTIVGYKCGTGTNDGAVVWRCRKKSTRTVDQRLWPGQLYDYFDTVPHGTIKDRRKLYREGWKYIGKLLTVRYQQESVYGVPIFPKGVAIRDYE